MSPKPILLLEINEIPWRVIDHYSKLKRYKNLRTFFAATENFTTETQDAGELSPWVTWPTLHRGIPNTEHKIAQLGQDPATFRGTPIWDDYRAKGYSIGVFGSLQSWPPKDPGVGGFYVPDTFAADERCIPKFVEPFQRFNLQQTRTNRRGFKPALLSREAIRFVFSVFRLGIKPSTFLKILWQLILEKLSRKAIAKRPIFQTLIAWDIFCNLYDASKPPAFSTFFTNHVAGVMHRFWISLFSEDFPANQKDPKQLKTMDFAMDVLEKILGGAMAFAEKNPEIIIVFASSMGQAAVDWGNHDGVELDIKEINELLKRLGFEASQFTPLLAMAPHSAFECDDRIVRERMVNALNACRTESGFKLFNVSVVSKTVTIATQIPPAKDIELGYFLFADREKITWSEAGMQVHKIDPGTGYHHPEGVLAILERGRAPANHRQKIPATDIKNMLLALSS